VNGMRSALRLSRHGKANQELVLSGRSMAELEQASRSMSRHLAFWSRAAQCSIVTALLPSASNHDAIEGVTSAARASASPIRMARSAFCGAGR
jgi:hypothetical protein